MDREERIFGPHNYETYRQYQSRLKDDRSMTGSRAAALMATAMMMQGKANQTVDREKFYELSRRLQQQPTFRRMLRDEKAQTLLRSGSGSGLINMMADKETERQKAIERYRRPKEYASADAAFLGTAIEGLKKRAPARGAAAGDPELERQQKRYEAMMKRLDRAKTMAEKGEQLTPEQTKDLVVAVKKYNDGGKKKLPGGEKEAEGHLEAMCVLNRYMPGKDFHKYCQRMNEAHGLKDPREERYADPEAFPSDRLTGGAKTAKEWYAETQKRLNTSYSLESCAEVAAIRKLSGGNPRRVIRQDELKAETKELCTPGSAFARTMQDEVSRKEFVHLAVQGKTPDLGANLLAAAREHSAKAAQWQINRSIRELTSGPVNAYVASENLANILAARELADGGNAGEQITNGAFRARADRLRADPSFQRLARRYSEDPTFRRRMNQKLMEDRSAGVLQEVYKRVSASAKVQEEKQKDPLAEAQPVQPGKPEPERGPELAAAL